MNKNELREYLKQINLSSDYKSSASSIIQDKVISSKEFKKARSIFVYLSTDKEVDTSYIIAEAFKQNKILLVPKCLDRKRMIAVRIDSLTNLKVSKYNILEPQSDNEYESEIDLAIIPCVSCSSDGKRLGHGLGYYDCFLASHQTYKMALCFHKLLSDDILMDKYDQYMDAVISED